MSVSKLNRAALPAAGLLSAMLLSAGEARAQAPEAVVAAKSDLDFVWILVAAALVLSMQLGFMLLEAGFARSKNSINVAQKNLADFFFATVAFAAVGFMLMFGLDQGGFLGFEPRFLLSPGDSPYEMAFFIFQAMFCGTAATIVSGAVAERFAFNAYLWTMPVVAALIYPVFGHWAWGGLLHEDSPGWLQGMGFVDFAGSTVVHSVGAWVALAAVIMVGPRLGRFDAEGRAQRIQGHSAVLATAGALILFFGWFGFNGGSTLAAGAGAAHILANTVLAAAFGGAAGLIAGALKDGLCRPERAVNGMLAGLVAVTAGCDALTGSGAMAVGALGALVAFFGADWLEKPRVDDAVGAVAVHGFAGAFGTIALSLLAPVEALPAGGRMAQLGVQLLGVGACFAWTMTTAFAWFALLGRLTPLRVSEAAEREGLNTAEHGSSLGLGELQTMLARTVAGEADLSARLEIEPGDEAAEVADLFNRLMARLETEEEGRRFAEDQRRQDDEVRLKREQASLEEMRRRHAEEEALIGEISAVIQRVQAHDLTGRAPLGKKAGALVEAGRGVNRLLDFVSQLVGMVSDSVAEVRAACREQLNGSEDLLKASGAQREAVEDAKTQLASLDNAIGAIAGVSSEAQRDVERADHHVRDGRAATQRAVAAMGEVKQKSDQALSVISLIEGIASQTNLLAINAAVEAARAGSHGAGFAVVSQEVRALSQRTAELSEQISQILVQSAQSVSDAVAKVEESAGFLGEISEGSKLMQKNVAAIVEGAERQASQSRQLLEAMERVAEIGGETGGVAERNASASRQLLAHADWLNDSVGDYRLAPRVGAGSA